MHLNKTNFLVYAMNYYENQSCHDIEEFNEDLKRFQHLRKLLNKYKQTGDLRERLILNHLIILYNVFGMNATPMLFMKLEDFHEQLKPFLEYLNYIREFIDYDGKRIDTKHIKSDAYIKTLLQRI
jgi:hypothetical protein